MATVKLKKIKRKTAQACFAIFNEGGNQKAYKISEVEYHGMGKNPLIISLSQGVYLGGFCRFDYETPTGLLGDNEYGDDGVEGGVLMVQIKRPRTENTLVIPKNKIDINGNIEDTDTEYLKELDRAKKADLNPNIWQ